MRPRWTLYVRWLLPHTNGPGGYAPSRYTRWEREGDFMLKRRAWRRSDECSRWHPCDTRIRRYGEPT